MMCCCAVMAEITLDSLSGSSSGSDNINRRARPRVTVNATESTTSRRPRATSGQLYDALLLAAFFSISIARRSRNIDTVLSVRSSAYTTVTNGVTTVCSNVKLLTFMIVAATGRRHRCPMFTSSLKTIPREIYACAAVCHHRYPMFPSPLKTSPLQEKVEISPVKFMVVAGAYTWRASINAPHLLEIYCC